MLAKKQLQLTSGVAEGDTPAGRSRLPKSERSNGFSEVVVEGCETFGITAHGLYVCIIH